MSNFMSVVHFLVVEISTPYFPTQGNFLELENGQPAVSPQKSALASLRTFVRMKRYQSKMTRLRLAR